MAPSVVPARPCSAMVLLSLLLAACADDAAAPPSPAPAATPLAGAKPPPVPAGPRGGAGGNVLSMGEVDLTRPPPDLPPRSATANAAPCADCDVILITLCSVRRDALGAYGGADAHTPNLDAIAASGLRFDAAYAASNFTLPSLTSIFTGQFPSTTGVMNWDRGIGTTVPLLPEVLGYYGFHTAAFTVDAPSGFRPEFGLDRGFQRMRVSPPRHGTPDGRRTAGASAEGATAEELAAEWVKAQPKDTPIFLSFHDRDAHYPYVVAAPTDDPTGVLTALWNEGADVGGQGHMIAEDPVATAYKNGGAAAPAAWRGAYRDAVSRMDERLGTLLTALDARGRRDRTLLIVVADHGESLWDHDEELHGVNYYDEVVHVPLLVSGPGVRVGSSDALVSHVDVFPTIAALIGAPAPAGVDGVSLAPVLSGSEPSIRSTTLVEGGVMADRPDVLRGALVSPPWALLLQPPASATAGPPPTGGVGAGGLDPYLFDLSVDPAELHDLAPSRPEIVESLRVRWEGFRKARAGRAVPMELRHDPAFVELLRRTGYDFAATVPDAPTPGTPAPGAPPGGPSPGAPPGGPSPGAPSPAGLAPFDPSVTRPSGPPPRPPPASGATGSAPR